MCGGWRDRHVGGMSAAGLGFTDFNALPSMGGLARYVMNRLQTLGGKGNSVIPFEPRHFSQVMRELLDPKNPAGADIPIYWSDGVDTVTKPGKRITSIKTVDGRSFVGRYYIDASYEGDLIKKAGVSVTKGREAAGTGTEARNGFRALLNSNGSSNHQFKDHSGNLVNIDPFVTAGNQSSGLLPNIDRIYLDNEPATGSADDKIQAYNFRQTLTTNKGRMVPMPSTQPSGYNALDYEALGRLFAADPTITLGDIILNLDSPVNTSGNVYDINAKGGLSSDLWGAATPYPAATYAQREVIWKRHEAFIRGFWWYLQYAPDNRVPAAVRSAALGMGLDAFHYSRPHPKDQAHWMPQLYVREAWRLVGDVVWDGNDIVATDGTAPRSTKTIAIASYALDSHSVQALARNTSGTWRIWNEGNFEDSTSGGTDKVSPIPYEAILPKASECENLCSVFAVSATHVAFGAIRMEFTSMLLAQGAAVAIKVATQNADQALQTVDYPTMRSALLATPSLTNEPVPILPQVN